MCGRYQLVNPRLLAQVYGVRQGRIDELQLASNANVRPTQRVPVLLGERGGGRDLATMRWGFVPSWAKDNRGSMINARAEGLADKPMFRKAFKSQRCAIPATGFYEWKAPTDGGKGKTPYLFTVEDAELFAFAGLWDTWQELQTCAILTTSPNELVAPVHDRMPVILRRDEIGEWLDGDLRDVGRLETMLTPYPARAMAATSANEADLRA